jgi:hypothetical protein
MRAVGSTCSAIGQADGPPVGLVVVMRLPAASPTTHSRPPTQSRAVSACAAVYGAPAIRDGAENVSADAEPPGARNVAATASAAIGRLPRGRS